MDNFNSRPYLEDPVVKTVSNCCWKVWKNVGPGMDEIFYKKALELELDKLDVACNREVRFESSYEGLRMGEKSVDMIVEGFLVVEAKATKKLCPADFAQLRTYLKLADQPYGILVNFGSSPMQFRIVVKNYIKRP